MAKPPLPPDVVALLREPNPAVISTVRADGHPVSVATWYLVEDDGRILVNMDEGRKRLDHLRKDPRVTLTALKSDDWYTHVSLQGRVVEMGEDKDLADIDRLAQHYNGAPRTATAGVLGSAPGSRSTPGTAGGAVAHA